LLTKNRSIPVWHYKLLESGDKWETVIRKKISEAKVAVIMVSAHCLASDYIRNTELPLLLQDAEDGHVKIKWIPVSNAPVEDTLIKCETGEPYYINDYQAVWSKDKPLEPMRKADRTRMYNKVYYAIRDCFVKPEQPA